jgi:hypothetical protein
VKLIAHGCSNRQLAEHLVITTSTAERHVASILAKLSMRSRGQVGRLGRPAPRAWALNSAELVPRRRAAGAMQHRVRV